MGHRGLAPDTTDVAGNSQTWWRFTAGTHVVKFSLDVDNYVKEVLETNNSTSVTITIRPQAALTAEAITYDPNALVVVARFDSIPVFAIRAARPAVHSM